MKGFSELHWPLCPAAFELCLHTSVAPPGAAILNSTPCNVAVIPAFLYSLFCAFRKLLSVSSLKERFLYDFGFGKRQRKG